MSTTTNPAQKHINKDIVFNAAMLLMQSNGKTSSLEVKEELRSKGFWAKQNVVRDFLRDLKSEHNWNVNDVGHLEYSLTNATTNSNSAPSPIEGEIIDLIVDVTNLDADDVETSNVLTIDLGMDHLDLISLQMAIDRKYNIDSASEDWDKINTVADVISVVEKLMNGGGTSSTSTSTNNSSTSNTNTSKPKQTRNKAAVINDSATPSNNPRVTVNIDYKQVVTGTKDAKDTCDGRDWFVSNKGNDPVIYDQKYSSDNVRTVYARLKGIKIQEVRASRVEHL